MDKYPIWSFTVSHSKRPDEDVRACGSIFYTDTAQEIYALAKRSGLEVRERRADRLAIERDGAFPVQTYLHVAEPEGSPALHEILGGLKSTYGLDLARDSLIQNKKRYFFSIRKSREFTADKIEEASYLWIHAKKFQIGTWSSQTDEEYSKGIYAVTNDSKQGTKVKFGYLSPFPAIAVDDQLRTDLKLCSLIGLQMNSVTVRRRGGVARKSIWNLSSSITLPRSRTQFINKHGYIKEPFDDWSDRWESAFFYDDGYDPPILKFSKEELSALGDFDIAKTSEKCGNGPRISFPSIIISQRFRRILSEFNIPGIDYTPISIG